MVSLCHRLRYRYMKHAVLVNNCYPTTEGEIGPRSAELSYLTFYASSRPAKLTKVSAYLRKKVRRDIRKGHKANNKVSLLILKALIQSCHHDLSLFCRSTVVILQHMLDTRDIDLIDLSCDTFYVFCSYYEGSSVMADAGFTRDFELLVEQFASFAVYNNDDRLGLQLKYSGHRALAAVINASSLNTSYIIPLLSHIIPPLQYTLVSTKTSAWDLAKSVPSLDIRTSVFELQDLTLEWIQHLAAQTLSNLCSLANGTSIRATMNSLISNFDSDQLCWWPTDECTSVMELVFRSIQSQYRYMLLSEFLHQLEQSDAAANTDGTDRLAGIVAVVCMILNSQVQLLGMPILEALDTLFSHLMTSLARHGYLYDNTPDQSLSTAQVKQQSIQRGLINSIVGLASQSYYANQWNDILGYFFSRICMNPGNNGSIDGVPAQLYRECGLWFVDHFQHRVIQSANQQEQSSLPAELTVESWTPALELLNDACQDTRISFATTLIHFLEIVHEQKSLSKYRRGNAHFLTALLKKIYTWLSLDDLRIIDTKAIFQLLVGVLQCYGTFGFVRCVPFIFALQHIAQFPPANASAPAKPLSSQLFSRAIASITLQWLQTAADMFPLNTITPNLANISQERQKLKQNLSSIHWSEPIVTSLPTRTNDSAHTPLDMDESQRLNEIDDGHSVTVWIDRASLTSLMTKESTLQSTTNEKADLKTKLSMEWDSAQYNENGKHLRITASAPRDRKPKLTSDLAPDASITHDQYKKQAVSVDNLKGALAAQLLGQDTSLDQESGDVDTVSIQLDQILSNLHPDPDSPTGPSLIRPPYASH
ncbi:hypothetical protein DM01DRAFT_1379836 [Hesseltinella vesiculosa]|uniref:Protein EFR3 n=1 Tax=Hesseltinella vesiculosa TaxID=101127 RepID=A0A1X2GVB1_9FUNG|nr:hypothetical protein DM01DRAFT_1379836 [Hesseltinella vesiculosa]